MVVNAPTDVCTSSGDWAGRDRQFWGGDVGTANVSLGLRTNSRVAELPAGQRSSESSSLAADIRENPKSARS